MDFLIVFWIICGIITSYIYQFKGRSVLYGLLVGVVLGPLGIYASVRSKRRR